MKDTIQQAEALPLGDLRPLKKSPSGILGLDEVTEGGLPRGRPTLVCGPAGCGKTLLSLEFLVRGITEYGENGVFLAFEETRADLIANVASLGFDLAKLEAEGRLALDHVEIEPSEIEQSGAWDLGGLFIRLGASIDEVGAKRIVIDTIENLFGAFQDSQTLRSELRRLFRWLKDRGVTAIITGERGEGTLTRHGIEEYVSDCVIVLDHRVDQETSTRRLRVLKYRGSMHGTNEYPFLIGKTGVSVVPITSLGLEHDASGETLSMGVDRLDEMLGGTGVLRGSSILVSGTAGTGKSTIAAQFCDAACRRGERALYFAFEESEAQIIRNMGSVGMDLGQWVAEGILHFKCVRPSLLGLEAHLSSMQDLVTELEPSVVVVDPISDLLTAGASRDVSAMLTRQVDFLKIRGATALFTSLDQDLQLEEANHQIAALIDVWLLVVTKESNGERNRSISVLKARGMAHSNQIREFLLTERGIEIADVHRLGEVLTGSARLAQDLEEGRGHAFSLDVSPVADAPVAGGR
ncbi:MAG TPA: circadian clock protein KaiC [Thermoleophilaceae bacterium]|jgi:circadian clock protein KaiC|nr:circadian clock protein KaiC [Thermoleophilaceae bacterium]